MILRILNFSLPWFHVICARGFLRFDVGRLAKKTVTYRRFARSSCLPILEHKHSDNPHDNPNTCHHYGRVEIRMAILNE
jgi:hypothetical protein